MSNRSPFSPARWATLALLVWGGAGCNSQVHLGNIGDGGANVLWRATFEPGDLSEWTSDNHGGTYVENAAGMPMASTEMAHGGRYSGRTGVTPAMGMLSFNYLFREEPSAPELFYSAWHYIPSGIVVGGWLSLVHFRSSRTGDGKNLYGTWDLNMNQRGDGLLYAHLFDYTLQRNTDRETMVPPLPSLPVPFDRWVHIEVYMKKAAGPTGRMTVWQDGELLLDQAGVATTPNDWVQWSIGSSSNDVNPTPALIYVDDAAISLSQLGPGT